MANLLGLLPIIWLPLRALNEKDQHFNKTVIQMR
jgi:hypothetical protein